ncbi:MAG: hypothetical protein QF521_10775 [Alphaproteobacteria bacterium]|jgi:hypothetical protein|nr:hypothetical protein [Alphaproteobacteria bacterium]MDP6874004.1 hypothetical protein [Alphaproteobacteria bacterium]
MAYELVWEPRGKITRYTGIISDDDILRAIQTTTADPRFESLEYQIADFSDADTIVVSSETIRSTASLDREASLRNPKIRVAIVGHEQALLGLANMYRIYFELDGGTWQQEQFKTLEEARAWLGIADPSE